MEVVETVVLYLNLTFFAILGFLAREGLTRLTSFQGSLAGGVLWANFGGCVIMGMLPGNVALFSSYMRTQQDVEISDKNRRNMRVYTVEKEIPLYLSLATGLCGSITSFSSFMLVLFELTTNTDTVDHHYPNAGYGVMQFMAYTIITFSVSIGGYRAGQHITKMLNHERISKIILFDFAKRDRWLQYTIAFLGAAGWITNVALAASESSFRYWCLSCVISPFGVFVRFWLAKLLNARSRKFMFGTFAANMLAVVVIATLALLQRGKLPGGGGKIITNHVQCYALMALQDGFCGALSTISSFVAELVSFKRVRYAYFYAATSVFVAFSILVIILGSYNWTHGLVPACIV